VILWMTFSHFFPENYAFLRSPFHKNMIIVIGTLSIFLTGVLLTKNKRKGQEERVVRAHAEHTVAE
jgi:solute:Na+ symporter, SSS family